MLLILQFVFQMAEPTEEISLKDDPPKDEKKSEAGDDKAKPENTKAVGNKKNGKEEKDSGEKKNKVPNVITTGVVKLIRVVLLSCCIPNNVVPSSSRRASKAKPKAPSPSPVVSSLELSFRTVGTI